MDGIERDLHDVAAAAAPRADTVMLRELTHPRAAITIVLVQKGCHERIAHSRVTAHNASNKTKQKNGTRKALHKKVTAVD